MDDTASGFRLAKKEDIKPDAELFKLIVLLQKGTNRAVSQKGPYLRRFDKEPFRRIWDDEADYEGICIVDHDEKREFVAVSYFLAENIWINPLSSVVSIYLVRSY